MIGHPDIAGVAALLNLLDGECCGFGPNAVSPICESWVQALEIGTGVGDPRAAQLSRMYVCPTVVHNSNACPGVGGRAPAVVRVREGSARSRHAKRRGRTPESNQDDRDRLRPKRSEPNPMPWRQIWSNNAVD